VNRDQLQQLVAAGNRVKYLYFWGHRPQRDGSIGPGCLSQWWPAQFTVDGVTYASAEHYMMAEKARLFGDSEALDRILAARTPAEAKNHGREVRGFEDAAWEASRFGIVVAASVAKFEQSRTSASTSSTLASECWSKPVRSTGSGESGSPPTIPVRRTPPPGGVSTCSGSH
jgi:ribA/ribD-fused uncharacterized protein